MFDFNWGTVPLIMLVWLLLWLAISGRYQQLGAAIRSIPLTPAAAASAPAATPAQLASLSRIG